jgi:hypothetical protein
LSANGGQISQEIRYKGRHQLLESATNHKDARPFYYHSNSSSQHYHLPECRCDHRGSNFKRPEDPIPETHCEYYVVALGCCPGSSSCSGTWELTNTGQKIKKNKDVCTGMLEQIHKLLYAIIQVHITSNTGGELTPKMLDNLGQFAE